MPYNTNNKIQIVDASGDPCDDDSGTLKVAPTSGTKYATAIDLDEQEAAPAIVNVGGEYRATKVLYSDGDAAILQTDRNGHLNIAGSHIDDGDFTLGTSRGVAMMGFQGSQSIDSGDVGVLTCSGGGALKIMISETSTTVPTSSEATLGAISYTEGNTVGSVIGVVRNNALAALAGTDNELAPLQVNALGALYITGGEVEDDGVQSEPTLVGGRYDSSARTLDNGDAGAVALNASGHVLSEVAGDVGHNITGMVSDLDADIGVTAEKIHDAEDVAIKRIDIQAHRDNTGYIYVGDSGVSGNGAGGGIALAAGDFYSLDIDNTGDVYVAASVADEDVSYIYYT